MRFTGSRTTEFQFIHPPKRCRKLVFSPREPGRALQVPTPPNSGVLSSIISLILIHQAPGHPKMCSTDSRPTEFPFIQPSPPKRCQKRGFHLVSPIGHFRCSGPPSLVLLNSIISLILSNQALGHPKMHFPGSRPTNFPFSPPPPPQGCRKWGFSPHEPGRALQVPTPLIWGC